MAEPPSVVGTASEQLAVCVDGCAEVGATRNICKLPHQISHECGSAYIAGGANFSALRKFASLKLTV